MLTLFTCPKAFRGQVGRIQRNAIRSWLCLQPRVQILLFGNEEGTASLAAEMEILQVKEIKCNVFGTPLVNDLFSQANRLNEHRMLCYVNSDVILTSRFMQAIDVLSGFPYPFLMVGRCWELDVNEEIDCERRGWEGDLEKRILQGGKLRGPFHLDYAIFTSGLFLSMPPFALGRIRWDNWLVWNALCQGASVVDASRFLKPVHQNHGYNHFPEGKRYSRSGPEAKINQKLAGMRRFLHVYGVLDATFLLTDEGIRPHRVVFPFVQQILLRTLYWIGERCRPMMDQS